MVTRKEFCFNCTSSWSLRTFSSDELHYFATNVSIEFNNTYNMYKMASYIKQMETKTQNTYISRMTFKILGLVNNFNCRRNFATFTDNQETCLITSKHFMA